MRQGEAPLPPDGQSPPCAQHSGCSRACRAWLIRAACMPQALLRSTASDCS